MDPFALAELPVTGLLLVAIFWGLTAFINWVRERMNVDALQRARQERLEIYLRYTSNQFFGHLPFVINNLATACPRKREKVEKANDTPTDLLTEFKASAQRLFDTLKADPMPRQTIAATPSGVVTVTDGEIDLADVSKNLHLYDHDTRDLITIFLETRAGFLAQVERVNTLSIDAAKSEDYQHALYLLQLDTFVLALVTQAFWDESFRAKLLPILQSSDGKLDEPAAIASMTNLVRDRLGDQEFHLLLRTQIGCDQKDYWHTEPVDPDDEKLKANLTEMADDFTFPFVGAPLGLTERVLPALKWPLWAVGAFGVFAGILLLSETVRETLYPTPSNSVACATKMIAPAGTTETTCEFSADSLQKGMTIGSELTPAGDGP